MRNHACQILDTAKRSLNWLERIIRKFNYKTFYVFYQHETFPTNMGNKLEENFFNTGKFSNLSIWSCLRTSVLYVPSFPHLLQCFPPSRPVLQKQSKGVCNIDNLLYVYRDRPLIMRLERKSLQLVSSTDIWHLYLYAGIISSDDLILRPCSEVPIIWSYPPYKDELTV